MSSGNDKTGASPSLRNKLALTRISRWHGLSDEAMAFVRSELLASLGLESSPADVPATVANVPSLNENTMPLSDQEPSTDDSQIGAQIRHLVSSGAPWHVIFSLMWSDYKKNPNLIKAARILETAFVEASPSETIQIFAQLMTSGQKGFYWYLHPSLRDFIIEHAPQQYLDQLYWTIAKEKDDAKLSGIEMTYIFLRVATSSDKTAAWMYFRRHQERILSSFTRTRHFGMTREQLIFRSGELALSLGYSSDAKDLFGKLPQGTDEREVALQLMLRFESSTVDRERNSYFIQIENSRSWEERLALITSFCETTRRLGGHADPNRSALDLLVKSLLKWIPKNPEAWRAAGDFIVRNRDLIDLLPSLFQPLLDQSVIFHGPDIDGALWNASQNIKPTNTKESNIHAVALLHKYVTNPRLGEDLLWSSHDTMKLLEASRITLPWSWRDLIKTARQWINESTILAERDRKRAAAALRLATEGSFANKDTIESYLAHCTSIPEILLIDIARNALASNNAEFALAMLTRTGLKRHFTNNQLFQMWNLATQSKSPDLAWRIATVLVSRDVLPESIKSSWDISGEHRSQYQASALSEQDISAALIELSVEGKKLILALCTVGAKINELALMSEPGSHNTPGLSGSSVPEKAIIGALKESTVLSKASKSIIELTGIHMIPEVAAPFAQAIITSPWLFAFRAITERLSINSWGWNIEILRKNAKTVLPFIGRDATGKSSAKVNKWLSSLTSSERSAWNDLLVCTQDTNHDLLVIEIVKFACRLAVILYPSHLNALKTAQQLRPTLEILRDLEWFVMSDALTSVRKRQGTAARIAIPDSIKKISVN